MKQNRSLGRHVRSDRNNFQGCLAINYYEAVTHCLKQFYSCTVSARKDRPLRTSNALGSTMLLLAVSFVGANAFAQATTWKIDPSHSGVEFQIKHLGVSTVRGSFSHPAGIVMLDEKDMTKSHVDATIDATTVNTNEAKRDEHLKSPDFFNVAQFPRLTFKSTSVGTVDGKLQMVGNLTIAGVTKPVTLLLDGPAPPQKGMGGAIVSGFSATGTLSRKDFNFGSKYGSPVLGDEVKFTIDLEIAKQP